MSKFYLAEYDMYIDRSEIIGTRVREKREIDGFYSIHVGWHVDLVLTPKWYTFGRTRKVKMKGYIAEKQMLNEFRDALEGLKLSAEMTSPPTPVGQVDPTP
jgi:hypothetical protein